MMRPNEMYARQGGTKMAKSTADGIRIGVGVDGTLSDAQLTQARQMGCVDVFVANPWPSIEEGWTYDDLERLRARVESFDLRVAGIGHTPLDEFDQIRPG